MECNRDEATRAIGVAEKKFITGDVAGAKRFAVKAQNLYPGLVGLAQMLATYNVHLHAQNMIGGEVDWYGIIGVDPLADSETIKKQYKKLALNIHPDKNNSVGADEAFKLISGAWSLLSDTTKRGAYDHRRSKHEESRVAAIRQESLDRLHVEAQAAAAREEALQKMQLEATQKLREESQVEAKRQKALQKLQQECEAAAKRWEALQKVKLKTIQKLHEEIQAVTRRNDASRRLHEGQAAHARHEAVQKSQRETVQKVHEEAQAAGTRWEGFQRLHEEAQAIGAGHEVVKTYHEAAQFAAARHEALQILYGEAVATAARLDTLKRTHPVSTTGNIKSPGAKPDPDAERFAKKRKTTDYGGVNVPK